jgi:hypothetical protein
MKLRDFWNNGLEIKKRKCCPASVTKRSADKKRNNSTDFVGADRRASMTVANEKGKFGSKPATAQTAVNSSNGYRMRRELLGKCQGEIPGNVWR